MSNQWGHALCGCLDNITLCLITYFVPCYTAGKNAEAVGDSCIMVAALYWIFPIIGIYFSAVVRGKIRDQKGIPVSEVKSIATRFRNLHSLVDIILIITFLLLLNFVFTIPWKTV